MTAPFALTMGDPAGIGGELTLRAWKALKNGAISFFVIDDPARLQRLAQSIDPHGIAIQPIAHPADAVAVFPNALPVLPVGYPVTARLGTPDPADAPAIQASIEQAVRYAMEGAAAGIVTNPISKANLYRAGFAFPGHTEWLQVLTNADHAIMMLACPALRVVPVTVHVSLRQAIADLTTDRIVTAARVTVAALKRDFGIGIGIGIGIGTGIGAGRDTGPGTGSVRLAVAGLNPHAGEGGAMGDDEARVIVPAIDILKADGIAIIGPCPPDTMFSAGMRDRYDAAICMYHDQALIPLKTLDMNGGVNITLGLPIVRTSPDHGTAFDIAARYQADPSSLIAAIHQAAIMAAHRNPTS